jgi:hypothetical protein
MKFKNGIIEKHEAIQYEPLLTAELSEIKMTDSTARWIKNPNYDKNWHLQKDKFIPGKNWLHDKTQHLIYGWVEEITNGENAGRIEACIPKLVDEDDPNGSDCQILGYFNSVASAMVCVIQNNHPEYGLHL